MAIGSANCGQSTAGEPSMAATFVEGRLNWQPDAGKVELYPPAELALRGHLAAAVRRNHTPPFHPRRGLGAPSWQQLARSSAERHSACAAKGNK